MDEYIQLLSLRVDRYIQLLMGEPIQSLRCYAGWVDGYMQLLATGYIQLLAIVISDMLGGWMGISRY